MANTTDKSILTAAGKALLAQLNAEEKPLIIDKMIFANVPNRPEFPQPDDVVPTDDIVHQEQVEQRGRLSADSVIYSSTLTSDVGPFEFNWTGAYCSEYGVLVTIDHHALTPKTADEPGVAGNTLVRSVVLEYKDIAEITNITVDASSWQYNATDRMKKMDSDVAQSIIDQNGKDWFIEDGFLVTPSGSAYNIKAGAGYVSGNRVSMEFDRSVQVPNKPSFIYIDAHREGTPTGEQVTIFNFVVTAEEKDDYIDSSTGKDVKHFVCKIAQVLSDGSVSDLRPETDTANKAWAKSYVGAVTDYAANGVGDMVDGITTGREMIIHKIGQCWTSGYTRWKVKSVPVHSIGDFEPVNFVHVDDFGAKGDGVTDDYNAITEALNTGKSILFRFLGEYLTSQGLNMPNSSSRYGQSIYGNNAKLLFSRDTGYERCLSINGYRNAVRDLTFINKGADGTSTGLWYQNRQFHLSGLKFYGSWGTCLDLSQAKEGSIENLHIENRGGDTDLVSIGSGIALSHCLNIQITNSYIGWCERNITKGASVPGVGHGNEGIIIGDNTIIKAGLEQINLEGLHIDIHNNIIDLCGGDNGSAIYLKGQAINLADNWIADGGQDAANKTLVHFYDGCYLSSIRGNTFWRSLKQEGEGTLKALDLGATCKGTTIADNRFVGRMISLPIQLLSNVSIYGNVYEEGAQKIQVNGTRAGFMRLEGVEAAYLPGLKLGNDSDSLFNARLGSMGDSGQYAAHFVNNIGVTTLRTADGGEKINLGFNTSHSAVYVGSGNPTGRSINAAGTVNANGADYAEYMEKSATCGEIQKGDICGIDSKGLLTQSFSESIAFCIKSTNPSYVGNDIWFSELEPEMPSYESYNNDDDYNQAVEVYRIDLEDYLERLDKARSKVDRIAFCGQVPVNAEAEVGDYIIPVDKNNRISTIAMREPSFEQYQKAIGKVIKIDADGRPVVLVKIV